MNYSKIKSFFSNQFSISFIILIFLLVIVLIKQNIVNTDLKSLISFSNNINLVNNTIIDNSNLSTNSITDELNKTIKELTKIKELLTTLDISDKYSNHKKLLLDGLNKNILLQNNLNTILKNPNYDILASNNKECIALKNDINVIYKQCNELNLPVSLGKDDSSINYYSLNYINELLKLNRDKDITDNQYASYITQINNIYTKFLPLNENLFEIITSMKEENRSLSTILDDINSKIKGFEELKTELYSISVPLKFLNSFNLLNTVFDKYDFYINSLRDYILHDLNNSSDNKLLEKSKLSYEDLNLSINELNQILALDSIN